MSQGNSRQGSVKSIHAVEDVLGEEHCAPIDLSDPETARLHKRLMRKLDARMLIWSFFAYFANLLDRNNMQNAFTNGMEEDLELNSNAYNWAVTFFFIGYIILQIPGNIIITKVQPRLLLPSIVIIWGTVVCFMSLIQNHQGLWGLRFTLGFAEAAFYPGMMFLLGSWYTPAELGVRTMAFACGNQISGAFGGLIAGGIAQGMDGSLGMRGWKWLFIIEGLIGVIVGVTGYTLLPNFPHNTTWLSPEERELAIRRMESQGRRIQTTKYTWRTIFNVLATPYSWLLIITFACVYIGNNMSLNFAIILRDMGYEASFANYMNTPAYIFSAICALAIGYSSDRFRDRAWHLAIASAWTGTWYLVLAIVNHGNNPAPLLFVGVYAISANITLTALLLAWVNEIFQANHNARSIAVAFTNAVGNLAPNFINVEAWVVSDSPAFFRGKITSMAMSYGATVLCILIWLMLKKNILIPKAAKDQDGVVEVGAEEAVQNDQSKVQLKV